MPPPPADDRSALRCRLAGAGIVAASITAMNVATYGFTLVAARLLEPAYFGELTALMGVILVGNVVALGLQATTARRLAVQPDPARQADIVRGARRATVLAAAGIVGLTVAISPVLHTVLSLTSWWSTLLVGLTFAPLTVFGTQAGIAQGNRKWQRLSALYASMGLGRLALGTLAATLSDTPAGVLVGVMLGAVVPVLVGWSLLWPSSTSSQSASDTGSRSVLVETAHGSHALLAYFALTNADALLARIVLSPEDSGVYAAGLIVTKACLFLPQFVTVVAFPDLAQAVDTRTRRIAAGLVAALGTSVIAGTWLLPDLALGFVGGSEYADVRDLLPLFAFEGSMFALLHLLVYDALARRDRLITVGLWAGVGAAVAIALAAVDSVAPLPVLMTGAASATALLAGVRPTTR